MRHKVLVTLLVIVLGLVAGWFVWLWLAGVPTMSPVHPGASEGATKPKARNGYCCTKAGSACEEVSDPGLCFRGGGKAFNASKRNCDYYCVNVK